LVFLVYLIFITYIAQYIDKPFEGHAVCHITFGLRIVNSSAADVTSGMMILVFSVHAVGPAACLDQLLIAIKSLLIVCDRKQD